MVVELSIIFEKFVAQEIQIIENRKLYCSMKRTVDRIGLTSKGRLLNFL